jgi:two-component system sensor histidine kinase AlgZ
LIEDDPAAAVDAVERLSDLLRYALEGSKADHVSLRQELDAVRDYLALEGIRFGDRLAYEIDVDEAALDEPVPPFILQPVVENAVKHGVASRRAGGSILVRGRRVDGRLELSVEDDGPGQSGATGTKTGHSDLVQRLALVYGGAAEHSAGPGPDGGYRVRLKLPRMEATA